MSNEMEMMGMGQEQDSLGSRPLVLISTRCFIGKRSSAARLLRGNLLLAPLTRLVVWAGSRGLVLVKLLILSATFLGGAIDSFLLDVPDGGGAALVAMAEIVEPSGEDLAGVLAILAAGAGGLGLDDDASGHMPELDGRAGFVLQGRGGMLIQRDVHRRASGRMTYNLLAAGTAASDEELFNLGVGRGLGPWRELLCVEDGRGDQGAASGRGYCGDGRRARGG